MRILEQRALRRAAKIADFCSEFIVADLHVLDIGTGNGTIASRLRSTKAAKILGIDIVDYNQTDIASLLYNGRHLPFKENSFDMSLLIEVLHHCDDSLSVLEEARRVTKWRLLIMEDITLSKVHRWTICAYDFLMNLRHHVNTPFHFNSTKEWLAIFNRLQLRLVAHKIYHGNPWYSPMSTNMFLLEK